MSADDRPSACSASVHVRPGLFEVTDDPAGAPCLLGTRCEECGKHFFPRRARCATCFSRRVIGVRLSRTGRVESATAVRMAPTEYLGEVPYALGQVRLPEGVLVLAQLTGKDPGSWQVDEPVELVVEPIFVREDRTAVLGYRFRPRTGA